jgi:hypothetical protein
MARVIFSGAGGVGVAVGRDGPQPAKATMSKYNDGLRMKRILFLM